MGTEDGLVRREKRSFRPSRIEEVAGCLNYSGGGKSLEDMEAAIRKGAREAAKHGRR